MPDESEPGTGDVTQPRDRFSLAALTRAANVSIRTVRYYIAEGLLPPPVAAGPASFYTQDHLDRLRLIAHLKAHYLPLKEIRRRLAGLPGDEIRRILTAAETERDAADTDNGVDAASLDRILGTRQPPSPTRPLPPSRPPEATAPGLQVWGMLDDRPPSEAPRSARAGFAAPDPPAPPASILGQIDPTSASGAPVMTEATPPRDGDTWRRVSLGDDAELLIRDSAYRRRRDHVEWLVTWARRVFGKT
jgi:DNA-binding transcriptional MerR regulator